MVDPVILTSAVADTTTNLNTLWFIVAAALVLIMTPGVAFFYGGMARAKNAVSMMMLTFGSMALVAVLWVLYGYSMAFSNSSDGSKWLIPKVLGNPFANWGLGGYLGMKDGAFDLSVAQGNSLAFAAFQATFAIITVSLITGSLAARTKFGSFMLFTFIWVTLVYFPVASWVWGGGWIGSVTIGGHSINDFAGGTAVHINAGAAALALALVLGKRTGFSKSMPGLGSNKALALLGASLLWFGWFGFNAGSEGAVDGVAVLAWVNTLAAPGAAALGWLITEKLRTGKITAIGAGSGIVAGLVAITPACNILTPFWGIVLGLITGIVCQLAIDLKYKWGYDDSLDVVGVHFVGGWIGTLFIGFFGQGIGLFTGGGNLTQFLVQFIGALGVTVWSFGISWLAGTLIQKTIGFRIPPEVEEGDGIDVYLHGEVAYVRD
jgi:Amt family ammonium transporter